MICFCVNPIVLCMVSAVFLFAKFDFIDVLTPPSQWEVKLSFLNLCKSCSWLKTTDQHSANILIAVIWDCYICLVMCHMGQAIVRLSVLAYCLFKIVTTRKTLCQCCYMDLCLQIIEVKPQKVSDFLPELATGKLCGHHFGKLSCGLAWRSSPSSLVFHSFCVDNSITVFIIYEQSPPVVCP